MYKKRRKIGGECRDNENKWQQLRCPLPTNEKAHAGVQEDYNLGYVRYLHDM